MHNWPDILNQVYIHSGIRCDAAPVRPVNGGCINDAFLLGGSGCTLFIKTNLKSAVKMLEAEAYGLKQLGNSGVIRVPEVYAVGSSGSRSFIAMQFIEFSPPQVHSYRLLGEQLAALHQQQASRFGSEMDNTIGSTPQYNPRSDNWFDFWRRERLGYQLQLAADNGAGAELIDSGLLLGEQMEEFFDIEPSASCLHGDLWLGNLSFDIEGNPVIFDPAHYFGDRETDIAMTRLFGSAPAQFYSAYQHHYPLRGNYRSREIFYNIYHILNHYNIFGGGYLSLAQHMIQSLLSESN